eukprot:Skav220567  [mRNA]  locus=scaffold2140:107392:111050:- [translate_table: standard]
MESLRLNATLPSGRGGTVSVFRSGTVADLKKAVQQLSLRRSFLKLAAPDGRLLDDPTESLALAGLQDGDTIAIVVHQPKVTATDDAFAMWCEGGGVVTWGRADAGGDSSKFQHRLRKVKEIHATSALPTAEESGLTSGLRKFLRKVRRGKDRKDQRYEEMVAM